MTATKTSGGAATVSTTADTPSGIKPATKFEASGAPIQAMPGVDPDHPAVDNNPRANTTAEQNRIDFNDPGKPGAEAVADNLAAQQI